MFEVVGATGVFNLGASYVGVDKCVKLAQGKKITIKLKKQIAMQVDGEPWRQPPGII